MAELQDRSERSGGTPRDLLRVIFRRKWIFLIVVGATAAWVIYSASQMAPQWESAAKLLVQRGFQPSAFSPGLRMVTWEEEFNSEIETIASDRIRRRAQEILLAQHDGDSSAVPEIDTRRISAETRGKASILLVRYRDEEKQIVQEVVRALTQAYQEFRSQTRTTDPTGYLQAEIDQRAAEISEWEQRRADFLANEGFVQLPEERSNLLTERRNLQQRLADAQADVAQSRARLDWLRSYVASDREDPAAGLYAFQDVEERGEPILITLRRKIVDAKLEYFTARAEYTDNHPRVLALRDRLTDLEEALQVETRGYIHHMQGRLEADLAREAALLASLDYVNEQLGTFPDREAQLAGINRTIERLQDSYDALVDRQMAAVTTKVGSASWDVVVLQDAVEPYMVASLDYVRMAVVLIFSIFVAIGLALLRDNFDHSFRDRSEMEDHLGLPVLATIRRFRR
ncbi:MAG: hypothetical protein GF330_08525 [Candidatus Eisenbacteria bacterium]|nr:hypothetical protein [Candidatus Eisenbacteria bacterium]